MLDYLLSYAPQLPAIAIFFWACFIYIRKTGTIEGYLVLAGKALSVILILTNGIVYNSGGYSGIYAKVAMLGGLVASLLISVGFLVIAKRKATDKEINPEVQTLLKGLEPHFRNIEALAGAREARLYREKITHHWADLPEEKKQELRGIAHSYMDAETKNEEAKKKLIETFGSEEAVRKFMKQFGG